jgi:pyruvate dehydrogenase E1 component alpha subunit
MAVKAQKDPAKATKKSKSASKSKFSKETYVKWYTDMLLIRKFEEKAGQLYIQQKFGGFCHLYIGQEAIVAGTASACIKGDKHMTAYRSHGHPIALGTDPRRLMAELYGRSTGVSKGKGGSMHFFDKEVGFMGGHGIVGAQIPMGTGVAFAEQYKGNKNVVCVSMGDGAVRQGALHETFNMAMIWKLPVIFIIENNNYAMGLKEDVEEMAQHYWISEPTDIRGILCRTLRNIEQKVKWLNGWIKIQFSTANKSLKTISGCPLISLMKSWNG